MTKQEKIVVSAFTGVLMCDFSDMHEYVEKVMERPVWTHEMGNEAFCEKLKAKCKDEFLAICEAE